MDFLLRSLRNVINMTLLLHRLIDYIFILIQSNDHLFSGVHTRPIFATAFLISGLFFTLRKSRSAK